MCGADTPKCEALDGVWTKLGELLQKRNPTERLFARDSLLEEEELIQEISVLIKDLLIIDKQGNRNNPEFLGQVSLMFAQISVELLKMSLMQGESNESMNENLSEKVSLLLKEVLC